ncbi:MAG: SDR family oxidoreductase [Longimicrobiaceae bacterium]
MEGKVCLITGATGGIGRATALALARKGAEVVLVARSRERGEATREEIAREAGNSGISLLLADLASQAQIRHLAEEFRRRHDRLHVLINNAGTFTWRRRLTDDGLETQFAVNHLAPFLLTNLLLELLISSSPARIITVASESHRHGRLAWKNLQGEKGYSGLRAYGTSKLANVLFTRELARRLAGTGVTANAVHPGVVATEILLGSFPPLRLLKPFMWTPEQGAEPLVHLAADREGEEVSGRYFARHEQMQPAPLARDDEAARRLWELSEKLTGLENSPV